MKRYGLPLLVAVALVSALPIPADALRINWVIVDGDGRGTILQTEDDRFSVSDATIRAFGTIALQEPNCDTDHYHGTLGGAQDPEPRGCGWGKVDRFSRLTALAQDIANAVNDEQVARTKLAEDPPDFAQADQACQKSADNLTQAKAELTKLVEGFKVDKRAARTIRERIDQALGSDEKCRKKTQAALPDGAEKALTTGIADKEGALRKITKEKLLLAP